MGSMIKGNGYVQNMRLQFKTSKEKEISEVKEMGCGCCEPKKKKKK